LSSIITTFLHSSDLSVLAEVQTVGGRLWPASTVVLLYSNNCQKFIFVIQVYLGELAG